MIRCPKCNADTQVTETRDAGRYSRRRRVCSDVGCGQRVTTVEIIAHIAVDNSEHMRPFLDVLVVRRKDMEEIFQLVGEALIARHGHQATLALLQDDSEPTGTTPPCNPEGTTRP